MRTEPHPREIRVIVIRTFAELGATSPSFEDLAESVHIDRGKQVARRYRLGDLRAQWLVTDGLIKFYDTDGNTLRTVAPGPAGLPALRAA
jgi:hypothetical protein